MRALDLSENFSLEKGSVVERGSVEVISRRTRLGEALATLLGLSVTVRDERFGGGEGVL
jgi:hypothetical protein